MRVINYIKEIADDRKAAFAGLDQTDTPEVLLEKVSASRQGSSSREGERRQPWLISW